jgi:hypothetical protein
MAVILTVQAGLAEDWTAVKLRGTVVRLVDGEWEKMTRGTVVGNGQVVRTSASGHVQLVRGNETLDLAPDTQIVIFDKGGAKPFTTVRQYFGEVAVEAEARNVRHFAVTTPYLAAVVKGTKFVVTSGKKGASVTVSRGSVEVDGTAGGPPVLILPGQSAVASAGGELALDGPGNGSGLGLGLGLGRGLANAPDAIGEDRADQAGERGGTDRGSSAGESGGGNEGSNPGGPGSGNSGEAAGDNPSGGNSDNGRGR